MGPRRAPSQQPPESPDDVEPTPQTEATLNEQIDDLRRQIRVRRQQQILSELSTEIAGGARASSTALTDEAPDLSFTTRKRAASSEQPARARRALPPPVYQGANLRELREFLQGCAVYFAAVEEDDERRRIALAASYLRGEALRQWSRIEKPVSWAAFEKNLRDMIQDPANRTAAATLRMKGARQAQGQSVREFANYLEELEEDIPEMSVEETRAWALLNGLRLEVRSAVLRDEREIRSREQVIAAAQRVDELEGTRAMRQRSPSESYTSQKGSEVQAAKGACFVCQKKGHKAKDCPDRGSTSEKPK